MNPGPTSQNAGASREAPPPLPVIPDHTLVRCIGEGAYGQITTTTQAPLSLTRLKSSPAAPGATSATPDTATTVTTAAVTGAWAADFTPAGRRGPADFGSRATPAPAPAPALSGLRRHLIRMTANGPTDQPIADLLGLSIHTVTGELRRARAALGARNRVHAVALCMAQGLIHPHEITTTREETA